MVLAMTALLGLFALVENAIAFPLHALLAGLLLLALRGNALRLQLGQCFRIALAALAIKPWAILVLYLAGTGPGSCLGLLVWPATALLLALIATRSYRPTRPPDLAPSPAPPSPER